MLAFLRAPHAVTLSLIAATMLILEVAQIHPPRLLADQFAADRASTEKPSLASGQKLHL